MVAAYANVFAVRGACDNRLLDHTNCPVCGRVRACRLLGGKRGGNTMTRYLKTLALAVTLFVAAFAGSSAQQAPAKKTDAPANKIVRLFAVKTGFDSGFLDPLLADFQKKTGYQVRSVIGQDAYRAAMKGDIDVVLSHYRHDGLGA